MSTHGSFKLRQIKVVIPTGPKISFTSETGNYSTFDVATMYNVIGQTVKLHAVAETRKGGTAEAPTEITGSTAAVKDGDTWLTSSANVGTAAGDYTLTLGAKQTGSPLPSTTVSFASVVTPEGFTPTVIGGATWLSASEVTNGSFSVTITDATEMDTTPKTDSKTTLTNILDSSNTFEIEVVTKVPVVVP